VFDAELKEVCDLYHQAQELAQQSTHLVSCDEMTGIQATERKAPTKPMKPGIIERQEFEYIRHGTLSLIANFEVASGLVLCPSIGPTRTEVDFAAHIQATINSDPTARWIFIVDQLNIHKSETLVQLVAQQCGIEQDLGKKAKQGILQSMATRADFLKDKTHRIRFVYVPKHTSWLNQIELWFSILVRRLLKRGSFSSIHELQQRILAFISYFNQTMAKPFKWTYKGRPLTV
jgi:transposase